MVCRTSCHGMGYQNVDNTREHRTSASGNNSSCVVAVVVWTASASPSQRRERDRCTSRNISSNFRTRVASIWTEANLFLKKNATSFSTLAKQALENAWEAYETQWMQPRRKMNRHWPSAVRRTVTKFHTDDQNHLWPQIYHTTTSQPVKRRAQRRCLVNADLWLKRLLTSESLP